MCWYKAIRLIVISCVLVLVAAVAAVAYPPCVLGCVDGQGNCGCYENQVTLNCEVNCTFLREIIVQGNCCGVSGNRKAQQITKRYFDCTGDDNADCECLKYTTYPATPC
jgi:hypothetical protein